MSKIDVHRLRHGRQISLDWIHHIGEIVILGENRKTKGILSIIIVDNENIRDLNSRFLKRDEPTDVIAFPLGDAENDVWGEVYISEDQAAMQASLYGICFEEELARLVIHGILHLLDYDDKEECQRKRMKAREDYYLARVMQEENTK